MAPRSALLIFISAAALTAALAAASACATEKSLATTRRERLEQFSTAMAQAGLSVPVAPRLCEEPTTQASTTFDEEIGCVAASAEAPEIDVVTIYARAVLARRVPAAPESRADALARAFLEGDPAFVALASSIEADFDARRKAHASAAKASHAKAKKKAKAGTTAGDDAGPDDDDPDAGPDDDDPDAGPDDDDPDAGPDAGPELDAGTV